MFSSSSVVEDTAGPETSVPHCQSTLRKVPEGGRYQRPYALSNLEFRQTLSYICDDKRMTLCCTHQSVGILTGRVQLTGGPTDATRSTNSIWFNYHCTVAIQRIVGGRWRRLCLYILLSRGGGLHAGSSPGWKLHTARVLCFTGNALLITIGNRPVRTYRS